MTATGGTKRARDAIATSQKSLGLPVRANTKNGKQQQHEQNRRQKSASSAAALDAAIPKHSNRDRKRTKLTQLRENRRIHRAVAAMEEQLESFAKTARRRSSFTDAPDGTSTSFSASSSFFFDLGSSSNHRDESGRSISDKGDPNITSDENELAALARSLQLEESSSSRSTSSKAGKQSSQRHRRRGAISIAFVPSTILGKSRHGKPVSMRGISEAAK